MSEKNLETYLNEQEADYQKKNEKLQKKKKSFKKKLIIFGVVFGVLVVFLFGIDLITKDNLYKELKDIQITDVEKMEKLTSSLSAVSYPDLYNKFEEGILGNKSINALNYGFLAENQYGYTSINDKGETLFHKDGAETVISTEAISQININKDLIVYKGLDKKLYSCKHDGTDKKVLIKDKVGTAVLSGEYIYYVNIAKASGVSQSEVDSNNIDTRSKCELWLETMRDGVEKVNKMFDLNISVALRFKEEAQSNGNAFDLRTV